MTDLTAARDLLARASELDTAGRDAEAAPVYEQAFAAGLAGDDLRRGLVQYGSTLRNLGRCDEALSVLRRASAEFPGSASVQVFLALALTSAGQNEEAVRTLITLALDQIGGDDLQYYQRALRGYAATLAG